MENNNIPIINKILLRNLDRYCSIYSAQEALDILNDQYEIDRMIKTFQYGISYKMELLILKIFKYFHGTLLGLIHMLPLVFWVTTHILKRM